MYKTITYNEFISLFLTVTFCVIFDLIRKQNLKTFDIVTYHIKVIYGKLIDMQLF